MTTDGELGDQQGGNETEGEDAVNNGEDTMRHPLIFRLTDEQFERACLLYTSPSPRDA